MLTFCDFLHETKNVNKLRELACVASVSMEKKRRTAKNGVFGFLPPQKVRREQK